MRKFFPLFLTFCVSFAAPSGAVSLSEETIVRMASADIVLLGEVHDNPAHHITQTELVTRLQPAALVFEMLTDGQAQSVTPQLREDADALADAALA